MKKYFMLLGLIGVTLLAGCHCTLQKNLPGIAYSADGVPINYNVYGSGDTALVFIHGWSCDSRYWNRQVDFFSKKYQVVTLDLAGHGHSGLDRRAYTVAAYAADVKAVVEALGIQKTVLVGHSMGGQIMAEAARLMPGKVAALIGVDTLQNIEEKSSQEQLDGIMQSFEPDFTKGVRGFVGMMFVADTDPKLRQWILDDVACAPDFVAKGSMREFFGLYVQGKAYEVFDAIQVPVYCINSDLWPTNSAANKRHIAAYELIIMPNLGHFPMLEAPDLFNAKLDAVLDSAMK